MASCHGGIMWHRYKSSWRQPILHNCLHLVIKVGRNAKVLRSTAMPKTLHGWSRQLEASPISQSGAILKLKLFKQAVNKKEQQPVTSTSRPRINEHSMLLVHHNIFLRCQKLIQSKNICEDICGISAIGLLLRTGPRVCGEPGLLTTKLT